MISPTVCKAFSLPEVLENPLHLLLHQHLQFLLRLHPLHPVLEPIPEILHILADIGLPPSPNHLLPLRLGLSDGPAHTNDFSLKL